MYQIQITDSVDTMTIEWPESPLREPIIEGATDVQTLDHNIYTDFFAMKRSWANVISEMSKDDYDQLRAFYDRQFTLYQYPVITISELGVTGVVARMYLSDREVVDNCGYVRNVGITFRETVQMTQYGS